jgi:hypothetical protein
MLEMWSAIASMTAVQLGRSRTEVEASAAEGSDHDTAEDLWSVSNCPIPHDRAVLPAGALSGPAEAL